MTGAALAETEPFLAPVTRRRRRRWRMTLVVPAILATVIAGAVYATRPGGSGPAALVGHAAPGFDLPNLVQSDPSVAVPVGQPTVVNFWASWCVPCLREMPALQAVHRQVGDRVRFIGVDHLDRRADALAFQRQTGVAYPSGFDPDGTTAEHYRLGGLPSTVVIGADGRVKVVHLGPLTQEGLHRALRSAFGPAVAG